jgi:hypothetical protein
MTPFLALITPVGDGGGSGPPLGIWGGRPPLYVDIGGPGPQPDPGQGLPGNQPYPGQGLPGNQPYPGQGLPGHQPYPGQGLPGNQPYPDQSLPGQQPGIWGPIFYPDQGLPQPGRPGGGRPSHPIYYPPVIWDPSRPSNPIVNPGDPDNPGAGQGGQGPQIEWKTAWSPTTGWVVVGVPTGEHVTPSEE